MGLSSVRRSAFLVLLVLVLSGVGSLPSIAADELPDNWKTLSVEELFQAVVPYFNPTTDRLEGDIDGDAVRRHAATLIANIDFATSQQGYLLLNGVHWAANPYLSAIEQERIRNGVLARQDDWTGRSYDDFNAKWMLMRRLELPYHLQLNEGRRWVQAGGTIGQIPTEQVLEARVFFTEAEARRIPNSFQVRWEGFVVPPQSGAYVFSISPINANTKESVHPAEITAQLSVGGKDVITAKADRWERDSNPISLTANEPVPVRMEMSFVAPNSASHTFHAQLYWSGPGLSKQIIPAAQLQGPNEEGRGLLGSYSWEENGQSQTVTRTDSEIDFVWAMMPIWFYADPWSVERATRELWESTTSPQFLDSLSSGAGETKLHPFLQDPPATASNLTSAMRKQFLQLLLSRPQLLDPVDIDQISLLHGAFRYGNPELALQVLGVWAQRHANYTVDLPRKEVFEESARHHFWKIAARISQEMPEQESQFQSKFLKLPDGRCSLPVAYILAYSYQGRGKMDEWLEILSAEREATGVSGDAPVNWLLARALAEEIRQGGSGFDVPPHARITDGMVWIDEARIVAQSPEVYSRLLKEWAGRLMATGQFDVAQDVLEQNGSVIAESDKAFLAEWKAQNNSLRQQATDAVVAQKTVAKKAYIEQMKARKAKAAAAGRTSAVSRYDAIISAAENEK